MKKNICIILLVTIVLSACNKGRKIPDVSAIKVDLTINRFEDEFFALDTNNIDLNLQKLYEKYPQFSIDFFQSVLGSQPEPDSIIKNVLLFKNAYGNIFQQTKKDFTNFEKEQSEIKKGFQFVKYYFPDYKLPNKLITYIGPWDARYMLTDNASFSAIFKDADFLAIGLQLSLGKDFFVYKNEHIQEFYPKYLSRRFDREYIPINAIKLIIDDLYPDKSLGKPLVEQMIEAGKRMYLLDAFLPTTADTLKTSYTAAQLKGCYDHEANIWSFFVTNDLVFATEPALTKDYMTDGPKTNVLGDASPGYIGLFVGWQIVKQWMSKNEKATLQELLNTPAKEIFEKSKYNPK